MSKPAQIVRIAVRASPAEGALWEDVLLRMNDAFEGACAFECGQRSELASTAAADCDIVCLSMLPELGRAPGDWPAIEEEWRRAASALRERALARGAAVFVITLFRYTTGEDVSRLPLLRRLNLLAIRLSQEFGLFVIDIDRALAHIGAVNVYADSRLLSVQARHFAADTIAESLLGVGMDHVAPTSTAAALDRHRARSASRRGDTREPPRLGLMARSRVNGHDQTSVTETHDVYGGIHSILRDVCAPRLGLKWRMPLLQALFELTSARLSGRIVRRRP
jgi:hypothetical protein